MAQAPPIDGRLPGRVPPSDLEAEQSVLGAMLLDELAIIKVSEFLRPQDFYRKNHEDIYRAALELLSMGEPIDIVTVGAELEKMGVLERVGGRSYLAQLEQAVPTAANIEYYGRIVKEKSTKRSLISAGGDIAGLGYDDAIDAPDALNRAQKVVFDISEDRLATDFEKLFGLLRTTMERVDALQNNVSGTIGVPSGFYDLDAKTNGFKTNELVIIAGRPSMGKTSLALNIALEAAVKEKVGVAIFSLEMSKDQLAERLLCEYARVDAQRLHRGLLGESEHERLAQALGPLGEAPIFIDDSPMLDELMLLTKARRIKLQESVGMVIVDYLQLMHSRRGSGDDNRVQEVSQISRSMKALARELKVPVLALSQLSRGPEQRTDKRPMLSDLRESGCLTGETPVFLPETGGYRTMRELAGRSGFEVLALDPSTWKFEPRKVEKAFSTGVKPVYRLTTALGRTLRATANHKFLAFDGWRRLDELSPGTHLALPRHPPSGEVRTMTGADLALPGNLIEPELAATVDGPAPLHRQNISRELSARVATLVRSDELPILAEGDVYWDRIVSIEPDGEEETFDLTVEGLHNFVAADIVVHNSIEQDADVVIFLYREGYYNKADTTGIAEIIVAKNRNGPTGTVNLRFRPELTRFENLDLRRRGPDDGASSNGLPET